MYFHIKNIFYLFLFHSSPYLLWKKSQIPNPISFDLGLYQRDFVLFSYLSQSEKVPTHKYPQFLPSKTYTVNKGNIYGRMKKGTSNQYVRTNRLNSGLSPANQKVESSYL